jgi:hypothetical protein
MSESRRKSRTAKGFREVCSAGTRRGSLVEPRGVTEACSFAPHTRATHAHEPVEARVAAVTRCTTTAAPLLCNPIHPSMICFNRSFPGFVPDGTQRRTILLDRVIVTTARTTQRANDGGAEHPVLSNCTCAWDIPSWLLQQDDRTCDLRDAVAQQCGLLLLFSRISPASTCAQKRHLLMAQEQAEKPKGMFASFYGAVVGGVGAVVDGVGKVRCFSVLRVAVSCRRFSTHARALLNPGRSEVCDCKARFRRLRK